MSHLDDTSPGPARQLLERELSRPEYQPTLLERIRAWVSDQLDGLFGAANSFGAPSVVVATLLGLALVIGAVALAARLRPAGRVGPDAPARLAVGARDTAAAHRARARAALGAGDLDTALVEAVRAIARTLDERGVGAVPPGATTHDVLALLDRAFPDEQAVALTTIRAFEACLYGAHPAGSAQAEAAVALDGRLQHARPAPSPQSSGGPVAAVPR